MSLQAGSQAFALQTPTARPSRCRRPPDNHDEAALHAVEPRAPFANVPTRGEPKPVMLRPMSMWSASGHLRPNVGKATARTLVLLTAGTLLVGCQSDDDPQAVRWPTAEPVLPSRTAVASSRPPGASVEDLATCTSKAVSQAEVAVPVGGHSPARVRRSAQVVTVLLPTAFLPLRVAHMPAFAPRACGEEPSRHGAWARVVVHWDADAAGSLVTNFGPTQWSGRPLVAFA